MYKTFKLHDHDLKFHTKDIKEEKEKTEGKPRYKQQGLRYYQKTSDR